MKPFPHKTSDCETFLSHTVEISGRQIGLGLPVYIVAELSANHRQNFEEALRLVEAAKAAGADAVKLQTYTPDTITIDCDSDWFRHGKGSLWEGQTLYDLYKDAHMPWEWQPKLKRLADDLGMTLFSSPFDHTAVDFLEEMDVPAYKIASFEIVDLPLIRRVARTGKPMIISTGMATLSEIDEAVSAAREAGATEILLLKCTSSYPADPEEINLRTIPHLAQTYGIPCGLSDHTFGTAVPLAATALGACMIEKHLTLSRDDHSLDSPFSLEPQEFRRMVNEMRTVEKALGGVSYGISEREAESRVFRRSLFVVEDVRAGDILTKENMRSIRPGHGLAPKYHDMLLGRRVNRDVRKGTPLTWDLIFGS